MPEFLLYGNLQPVAKKKIPIAKAYNQCTTQTRHFPLQLETHHCNGTTILSKSKPLSYQIRRGSENV